MQKNVASRVNALMLLKANGNNGTGLTVTARISQDGAAWKAATNAVTEAEDGAYTLVLDAAETNCDHLAVKFTESTAITVLFNFFPIDPSLYQADVSDIPKRGDGDTYRQLRDGTGNIVQQIRETLTATEQP